MSVNLSLDAGNIKKFGWKQGSLLKIENQDSVFGNELKPGFYIVVSHSCDIVHASFENEPYVEVILASPIKNLDGNFTGGKSPRILHLTINANKTDKYYECHIKNRCFIDRKKLAAKPSFTKYKISPKELDCLTQWLADRYSRAAFPDAFNNRINKQAIQKTLKTQGRHIMGIYIKLHTEQELPEQKNYKITLMILADPDYISEHGYDEIDKILEKIVDIFVNSEGIEVITDYSVKTPDDVTLDKYMEFKKIDFDFLSYREKPGGKTFHT